MAEGLARAILGDGVRVQSAGSMASRVHPLAIQAMAEIGIDISDQTSKSIEAIDPGGVDTIVTLCAEEFCPAWFGSPARLHWPLPDPTAGASDEERLARFRTARDELARRIERLR